MTQEPQAWRIDHPDDQSPDEQQKAQAQEQPTQQPVPLVQSLGFGAGTFLTMGAIDLLAHFGPTGLVVGGIAAYVASKHGPDLAQHVRETPLLPARASHGARPSRARRTGTGRSFVDRALGRFPAQEQGAEEAACDDEAVAEDAWVTTDDEEETYADEEDWMPRPAVPSLRPQGEMIDLSPDVQVSRHELVGKAIFVCGIRRQGKTTLGARLAEQLGRFYLPLFIPDLEGDYLSLADVLPRAVIAGHPRAASQYRASQFVALDSGQAAFQLGYDTLEAGYQVILDLASYTSLDVAVGMQVNLIRGLFHWAHTPLTDRVPCHVWLDEAQRYLPQTLSDSVIVDRGVLGALLRAYMDIIAIGGKRGIAPVILTQRFAQVNKKIMAQSEVFFLLRQTNDLDLDRCMEYVSRETATKEQIARFVPGQGVYIAADGSQCATCFHKRDSSGERSLTPRAEAAWRYAQMPMPPMRSQAETALAVPAADHSFGRVTMLPVQPPVQEEPTFLERAVTAYLQGATSQPKLAAALKISPWDARKLMPEVEAEVKHLQAGEPS